MKVILTLFLAAIPGHYARVTAGDSFAPAIANLNNFGQSVAFMLSLENYSAQYLTNPQYRANTGSVYDRPQPIAPGKAESMTGHKTSHSWRGVSGVVSWDIGNTGKMVVVMYYKPWSTFLNSNTLAIGIFPTADLSTGNFYSVMRSGAENGFIRKTIPGPDGWHSSIRFRDDSDYMVDGDMGDAPKATIGIQFYPKTVAGLNDSGDEELITTLLGYE